MRSRHTGQVGSSIRSGVGGGNGLSELARFADVESAFSSLVWLGVSTVIDLINVTWHISGYSSAVSTELCDTCPRTTKVALKGGRDTYHHAVEHLAVELLPPVHRTPLVLEFHKHHVAVHPARHDHPVVADVPPPLLPDEAEEIARRQVAGDSRDAQYSAVIFVRSGTGTGAGAGARSSLLRLRFCQLLGRRPGYIRFFSLPVEVDDAPASLRVLCLERHVLGFRGLACASEVGSQRRSGSRLHIVALSGHGGCSGSVGAACSFSASGAATHEIEALDAHSPEPPVLGSRTGPDSGGKPRRGEAPGPISPLALAELNGAVLVVAVGGDRSWRAAVDDAGWRSAGLGGRRGFNSLLGVRLRRSV